MEWLRQEQRQESAECGVRNAECKTRRGALADGLRALEDDQPATGSGFQCANDSGKSHPDPLPQGGGIGRTARMAELRE